MKLEKGSILDIKSGIIVQQVNNKRRMGAGLARQIAKKWPVVRENYIKTCPHLGNVEVIQVESEIYVANLYSQIGYGRDGKYTSYKYFAHALSVLETHLHALWLNSFQVYFPARIGCGLGGGDWHVISALIEEQFPDAIIMDNSK